MDMLLTQTTPKNQNIVGVVVGADGDHHQPPQRLLEFENRRLECSANIATNVNMSSHCPELLNKAKQGEWLRRLRSRFMVDIHNTFLSFTCYGRLSQQSRERVSCLIQMWG